MNNNNNPLSPELLVEASNILPSTTTGITTEARAISMYTRCTKTSTYIFDSVLSLLGLTEK